MTASSVSSPEPPAFTALRDYPLLLDSVEASMLQQSRKLLARVHGSTDQEPVVSEILHLVHTLESGLIAVEAPPGSGVTTVLSHLAAHHPFAFWFGDDDARRGVETLVAQIIALHRLPVPLIPPAVRSNPTALEHFLVEAVAQSQRETPVVLVIDPPACEPQPHTALPVVLPGYIPAGVVIIYGCVPGEELLATPAARVVLPHARDALLQCQRHILKQAHCPDEWEEAIVTAAQGNLLYTRLAARMLQHNWLTVEQLTPGIDTLHHIWWSSCDPFAQKLALFLAAAGEPLPYQLCARLVGGDRDPSVLLQAWNATGLIAMDRDDDRINLSLVHRATRDYIARHHRVALAQAHTAIANQARSLLHADDPLARESGSSETGTLQQDEKAYLQRQFSRHAALGTQETQAQLLPLVAQRNWIRMQERTSDTPLDAVYDLAWELRYAARKGTVVQLARSAALASTLVSLARMLSPEATVESLHKAVEQFGREAGLKRIRTLVDQLPDGQSKALMLRRLGEACYALKMRAAAMRLLSQALDLEEQKLSDAWREQRDLLHTALANAVLVMNEVDVALDIGARISHIERRGVVETNVVRWLLHHGDPIRAQKLARRIDHENLRAWAQAEVVVTLKRQGDLAMAEMVLADIQSETARAWAQIELACDIGTVDETAALQRIHALDSANQRDRGLAQLARAFALADKDGDALDAAAQIGDVAVRVSALLELRLMLEGLVAMLALEQATAVIGKLPHDVRVPLISMLAASFAALGRPDEAMRVAEQLREGEERDRARSRVAVALGQYGDFDHGLALARSLADDDERDWALDELVRVLGETDRWQAAQDLCAEISTEQQRSRTQADLAIARTRAGAPLEGLQLANPITMRSEYVRALIMIAPLLVATGNSEVALALVQDTHLETTPAHILEPAQVSRYLATVVSALVENGDLTQAQQIVHTIRQPLDRARAHLAIANAAAPHDPEQAFAHLGAALQTVLIGRDEAFRLLEQAVPVFAALGDAQLLQAVAAAVDEVDTW